MSCAAISGDSAHQEIESSREFCNSEMRLRNIRAVEIAERIFYPYKIFATRKYQCPRPHFSCVFFTLRRRLFYSRWNRCRQSATPSFSSSHGKSRLHFLMRIFFFFYFSRAAVFYFSRSRRHPQSSLDSLTFCMPQEILCRTRRRAGSLLASCSYFHNNERGKHERHFRSAGAV